MIKDLFTGSLGKLNNHGGSRIYTTPNTILVPPEYEVDIGEHGDFISCSLDGRLWLFKNKIIALKWNEETGRMEFSASRSFNNNQFIARGIDWILTKTYIIQYNNGKIVVEAHKIKDIQPMENFYSLLPALDGFQIIKGYLIRKPGAEHTDLVYPVENAGIFLTPNGSKIWGKTSSYAGKVEIEDCSNGEYTFIVAATYAVNSNITGISFLGDKLYGFQLDGNHKGLCYASQNLNLYSFAYGEWETLSEATGKIYFDVFNHKALALHDKGMEILPDKKKVECNALEQWIAPSKELHYVSNNIIVSAFSDKVLATNLILKYYRSLLKANKELPITAMSYEENKNFSSFNLSMGENNTKIKINRYLHYALPKDEDNEHIKLLQIQDLDNFWNMSYWDFYQIEPYPIFFFSDEISYDFYDKSFKTGFEGLIIGSFCVCLYFDAKEKKFKYIALESHNKTKNITVYNCNNEIISTCTYFDTGYHAVKRLFPMLDNNKLYFDYGSDSDFRERLTDTLYEFPEETLKYTTQVNDGIKLLYNVFNWDFYSKTQKYNFCYMVFEDNIGEKIIKYVPQYAKKIEQNNQRDKTRFNVSDSLPNVDYVFRNYGDNYYRLSGVFYSNYEIPVFVYDISNKEENKKNTEKINYHLYVKDSIFMSFISKTRSKL